MVESDRLGHTSSMLLGLILLLGSFLIVGAFIVLHEIRNAPVGFEDENGFHSMEQKKVNLALCSSPFQS